jgi:hypothetical protein
MCAGCTHRGERWALTSSPPRSRRGPGCWALTWVDSFTGHSADLHALGEVCQTAGILSTVNASQAIGARALDVRHTPVDAVACCGQPRPPCRTMGSAAPARNVAVGAPSATFTETTIRAASRGAGP